MWRADYSLESPFLPKSPRCRWAACLISTDYSLIGVLQNTMTSALFTDGINHSLAELEIPTEFVPSSLFRGCIAQPPVPTPTPHLLSCLMPSRLQIISNTVYVSACKDQGEPRYCYGLPSRFTGLTHHMVCLCYLWSKMSASVSYLRSWDGAVGLLRLFHLYIGWPVQANINDCHSCFALNM